MTELKPCPFCGGEVKLVTDFSQNKDHVYNFECGNCGVLVYMDDLIDKDKSIESWNKRPNPWHTGTPTEEGWYLLAVKHGEKIHYNANRLYSGGEWFYSKLGEVLAYQKIEPYEASKEKRMTPEEFARRMREVVNGETEYDKGDNEIIHEVLDDIMCECLRSIGYGEGVDIFENYEKWYA